MANVGEEVAAARQEAAAGAAALRTEMNTAFAQCLEAARRVRGMLVAAMPTPAILLHQLSVAVTCWLVWLGARVGLLQPVPAAALACAPV